MIKLENPPEKNKKRKGYRQGYFVPKNPDKYVGNVDNIVYRSSWELAFCQFLDGNPNIMEWSSEEIAIPYVKPTTKRVHKYYPDFWIKYTDKQGQVKTDLVEVKPDKQTRQPTTRGKRKKQQTFETIQYAINVAKWSAASAMCEQNNMKFRIVTEKQLFG